MSKYSKLDLLELPFMDNKFDLEERIDDLLGRLTLNEKFRLLSGRHTWYTKPIRRLGIRPFAMFDGPHGVRVEARGDVQSTYFPSGICRAATWNLKLNEQFGISVAKEVRDVGAQMWLAPAINIQRTPLCGRNFEYQTEDPYLNKELTVTVVKAVQSQKIAACVKHFICNNQEWNRFKVDSVVSERALHEIYYPAFKAAVQEADAWSIMSCYNKLNGTYGSEHKHLLREVLMKEWGFRGFVVSDWGATRFTDTAGSMNAGLTLEMPLPNKYNIFKLITAFKEGKFTEETLNDNVARLLRVMFLVGHFDDEKTLPKSSRNTVEHQELARKIAEEGIVLLKNEDNILPLDIDKISKIALIGPMANKKTHLEGGSSTNFPPYEIKPLDGIEEKCKGKIEIISTPSEADITIIIAGLKHKRGMDSEGIDRDSFDLPSSQIELIRSTIEENPKTIVVLTGTPVSMNEWSKQVSAIVQMWYAGMEGGNALASILFGDANPSGKLPITIPKNLSDSPAHVSERTYPGNKQVYYEEGIFVGYRHFDTKNIEPCFPFGHGLSYTTFLYENLVIDKVRFSRNDSLAIKVDITNSGTRPGSEVVQLYIQDIESNIERPLKELKRFKKLELKQGEKITVKFHLTPDDFSYYDEEKGFWNVENGEFNIFIGSSSRDIRLQEKVEYFS